MSHLLAISGSPTASTICSAILDHTLDLTRRSKIRSETLELRSLPAEDLLYGCSDSASIREATLLVDDAVGIIIASPVCRAAYPGIVKAFLDLLPAGALRGKPVLPLATGGPAQYGLSLDYALTPVVTALGADEVIRSIYVANSQVQFEHGGAAHLEEPIELDLRRAVEQLVNAVQKQNYGPAHPTQSVFGTTDRAWRSPRAKSAGRRC